MARVVFTQNLQALVPCPPVEVEGKTVRAVLDAVFHGNPAARPYVLDDQGALRHHVVVFVDGTAVTDRTDLSDPVGPDGHLHVMQALSGG